MADILIVDDHPLVSEALSQLITYKTGGKFRVVGTARNISDAIKLTCELRPDLVVVDVFLGDFNGFDLVKEIKRQFPQTGILMLSMHDEALYAERAVAAGANGYIMKQESSDDIISAISRILQGHMYLSDKIATMQQQEKIHRNKRIAARVRLLAGRERQVFELFGNGWTTRRIAEELNLSIKTIDTYRARIKGKLKLKNANELIHQAVQWVTGSNST